MPQSKIEIISIKRLKKDGSIDDGVFRKVIKLLENDLLLLLPVDNIYGYFGILTKENIKTISELSGEKSDNIYRIISNFKMLDEIAFINKLQFDFLHRIWPGELIVFLNKFGDAKNVIPVRMPKSKFILDIVNALNAQFIFTPLKNSVDNFVYKKREITKKYNREVSGILIIDEFCKEHTAPTIIDITQGQLQIIEEGRVSADEVKSLYFLGKDDINL